MASPTPPLLHQSSVATLMSAIKAMDRDAQVHLHQELEGALPDDPEQLAQLCQACVVSNQQSQHGDARKSWV